MCTGNLPDPAGVFNGKNASLPDPLNVHTPTPQQVALEEAKKRAEEAKAAAAAKGIASTPEAEAKAEVKASPLQIKRKVAPQRKKSSLRIDLQTPGKSSAGGPPTLGA